MQFRNFGFIDFCHIAIHVENCYKILGRDTLAIRVNFVLNVTRGGVCPNTLVKLQGNV